MGRDLARTVGVVWERWFSVFCFFVEEEVGRVGCRRFRRVLLAGEEGQEGGLYQQYNVDIQISDSMNLVGT
jgi:hypothetical protein